MQKHFLLDAWRGSEYACVHITPNNVLCHHKKHLIVCFESLHGSRITLHGSRITYDISSKSQKRERLIIFILVNKKQYLRTLKSNIYHSNKREPPQFFHSYANSVFCHVLIHSVDQIHVLVVSRQKNVK